MHSYNIVFAGTPPFSVAALEALTHSNHRIIGVYTQPDRPAGRGRRLTPSAVKIYAEKMQLPVYQPDTLRQDDAQKTLSALAPDLMVVVAYGLILPAPVLHIPRLGCINIHASLLPHWRGAAPIQRAILNGDDKTGITIMQMDAGLDTGPMLYKSECPILPNDTSQSLHDTLAQMGADAILHTLSRLETITPLSQNHAQATYAAKLTKDEALLDWTQSAIQCDRHIRAFNPWPVAYFKLHPELTIRVWEATVLEGYAVTAKPGTLVNLSAEGLDVATGQGILRLRTLQWPGGRPLAVSQLLNAYREQFVIGSSLSGEQHAH